MWRIAFIPLTLSVSRTLAKKRSGRATRRDISKSSIVKRKRENHHYGDHKEKKVCLGHPLGGVNMRITYDSQADALYIELRQAQAHDNLDIEEGVSADLDEQSHIVGVEILDVSKRLTPGELYSLHVENLAILPEKELGRAS
jgi:uncharacterized protein YuzE